METLIKDCWNQIGVTGDKSCVELKEHIHCRNCPVYAAAAVKLFDRERAAAGGEAEHADARAPSAKQAPDSAVVFRLDTEWFALPTSALDEIAVLRPVHSLPHRRGADLLGLANVRGELIVCFSLAKILGLPVPASASPDRHAASEKRLIVLRQASGRRAFPVDQVKSTCRFDRGRLAAVPATLGQATRNHTAGLIKWDERMIGLLDEDSIANSLGGSIA